MRHIISVTKFTPSFIKTIFQSAAMCKTQYAGRDRGARTHWSSYHRALQDRIMVSLFYEASTRTRHSFEAAMMRLGGQVITTENAAVFSSAIKGESLEDTIRIEGGYGDAIVLRHPENGAAKRASEVSEVPIINAGDGNGEHPTQALLDLFTIHESFPGRSDLKLTFIGDLLEGRTVHSLAYLAAALRNTSMRCVGSINFVAPKELQIDREAERCINMHRIPYGKYDASVSDSIAESDVIYMTRTQKERRHDTYAGDPYCLTPSLAQYVKDDAIIMHPLPRNDELPSIIDRMPQARYFEQAKNGLFVRMAILLWVFNIIGKGL